MELESGENLIFEGHPSWRSILGFYIKGLIVIALAVAIAVVAGETGIGVAVALVLLAILLVAGDLKRLFTTDTITNNRPHIRRGIIPRAEHRTLNNQGQTV